MHPFQNAALLQGDGKKHRLQSEQILFFRLGMSGFHFRGGGGGRGNRAPKNLGGGGSGKGLN